MESRDGLCLGRHGTVVSTAPFLEQLVPDGSQATIEIWLRPKNPWAPSTIFTFYTAEQPDYLSIRQVDTDLTVEANHAQRNDKDRIKIHANQLFRSRQVAFLAITSGQHYTHVYADGTLVATSPPISIIPQSRSTRLILGDSAVRTDSWSGELFGLAIYSRELSASQIRPHIVTWRHMGQPVILPAEQNIGLFLFNERGGSTVHDHSGNIVELRIPERYEVIDKAFLEPLWKEFRPSGSYWASLVKNVVGFVPFGFSLCAYLAMDARVKRPALFTIILGAIISFSIEFGQAFLPTRSSGSTDVVTNILGTSLGVAISRFVLPELNSLSSVLGSLVSSSSRKALYWKAER